MQVLHEKNHKMLIKFIKEEIESSHILGRKIWYCQDVSSSQFNLQIHYNYNQKHSKSVCEYQQIGLEVYIRGKKTLDNHHNNEEENCRGHTVPNFKIHGKAILIKTVLYWWKNKWINRMQTVRVTDLNRRINTAQWSKENLFMTGEGTTGHLIIVEEKPFHKT